MDGKPAIFETINTSFTYLKKGTELFKVVNVPMQNSMEQYVTLAKQAEENQTEFFTASAILRHNIININFEQRK